VTKTPPVDLDQVVADLAVELPDAFRATLVALNQAAADNPVEVNLAGELIIVPAADPMDPPGLFLFQDGAALDRMLNAWTFAHDLFAALNPPKAVALAAMRAGVTFDLFDLIVAGLGDRVVELDTAGGALFLGRVAIRVTTIPRLAKGEGKS
jgi:hypothetical protein